MLSPNHSLQAMLDVDRENALLPSGSSTRTANPSPAHARALVLLAVLIALMSPAYGKSGANPIPTAKETQSI